jgi:hypothetical protein
MREIIASNSHYEITDYNLGDNDRLETFVSIWDKLRHKYDPLYYYNEETKTLRIPRGIDPTKLESIVGARTVYDKTVGGRKVIFNMTKTPRNAVQRKSIRFLTGQDEYDYTGAASQLVLSLPSGFGKTYCAIAAMSLYSLATMIIVHSDEIRGQWMDRLLEYTNIPPSSIIILDSSETMHKYMNKSREMTRKINKEVVYIATHSLLRSYSKQYGYDGLDEFFKRIGIGVKIIDEAHKEFYSTMEIDNAVHVYKNFYLTATFGRTDEIENKVFQRMFQNVFKLKVTNDDADVQKNVVYVSELFTTRATKAEIYGMRNGKGTFSKFSIYKYIEYAMRKGVLAESYKTWLRYFVEKLNVKGMILVISPKKESCNYFMEIAQEMFPDKKCCVYTSDSKVNNLLEYDIVCATAKMFGTGNDIDAIEVLINMEPMGSAINIYQIFHRLMRGNDEDIRYYVDIIDKSVTNVYDMYKRCRPTLEAVAKKHIVMDTTKKK